MRLGVPGAGGSNTAWCHVAGVAVVSASLRAVPVLVTAADLPLSRRLVLRLLDEGGEVRAYGAGDLSAARAAGAFIATGTVDDEGRLEAALADVHTVVHVGGGVTSADPWRQVRDVEVLLTAAQGAGVQRIIALSLPGAGTDIEEPLRRAKGEVEQRLADTPIPTIVLRCSLVATPAILTMMAAAGLGSASRRTEVAPVRVEDLLEVVVAFDRARSQSSTGHLVVAVDGPERLTIEDLLERSGPRGLVGARIPSIEVAAALEGALTGPWWTDDPVIHDGWRFADHRPRPPAAPGEEL